MKITIPYPRKYPGIWSGYLAKQMLGLLILITFSCQEFEPIDLGAAFEENDIHYVDIDKARMIASTIEFPLTQSEKQDQLKSSRIDFDVESFGSKNVQESKSPLGKGGKALYHIINYEDGGFVIISADDRLLPILAISFDNKIPLHDENDLPDGLIDWFSTQEEIIEFIRDNPDAEINLAEAGSTSSSFNLWDPCAIQRLVTTENMNLIDPCDQGGGCEDQFTQVGPLITTEWDQDCGYNQLMPIINCNPETPCGRAFVGCVAVAIAQVMRYHTHPNGYNYWNMPNNAGNIHNATLMTDVFNSFPLSQQTINCSGTGISYNSSHFANAFTNSFGYSSASQGSFNSIIVRQNLNQGRPVILGGGGSQGTWFGHMWVTDGYQRTVFCETGNAYLKLYMNWGWGGIGNGFFSWNNFSVTINGITYSFNNNKYMVYNIIP